MEIGNCRMIRCIDMGIHDLVNPSLMSGSAQPVVSKLDKWCLAWMKKFSILCCLKLPSNSSAAPLVAKRRGNVCGVVDVRQLLPDVCIMQGEESLYL